jgi:hypothetical protein
MTNRMENDQSGHTSRSLPRGVMQAGTCQPYSSEVFPPTDERIKSQMLSDPGGLVHA